MFQRRIQFRGNGFGLVIYPQPSDAFRPPYGNNIAENIAEALDGEAWVEERKESKWRRAEEEQRNG